MGLKKQWAIAPLAALFALTGEAVAEPKLVSAAAPEYPRAAERREIEGSVTVSFEVQADGRTSNVAIIEATPAGIFDTAAVKAVEQWRFEKSDSVTSMKKRIAFQVGS
ncbi:MAG: energy transducer TonB [Pseudomonadota bacterium]